MAEKVCRKCQESWPDDNEFYKTEKDTMCIACQYERDKHYKRNRYITPEKRERYLAQQRKRYAEKRLDPTGSKAVPGLCASAPFPGC